MPESARRFNPQNRQNRIGIAVADACRRPQGAMTGRKLAAETNPTPRWNRAMMISGGIPLTALNVAGSVAASQRSDADVDRSKSDAAGRRTQADQTVLASDALADVGEAEMSADRDPDGMLLYGEGGGGAPEGDEMSGDEPKPPGTARSVDADGVRGRLLDIDA